MEVAIQLFRIIEKHQNVLDEEDIKTIESIKQKLTSLEYKYKNDTNVQNINKLAKMAKEGHKLTSEDISILIPKK